MHLRHFRYVYLYRALLVGIMALSGPAVFAQHSSCKEFRGDKPKINRIAVLEGVEEIGNAEPSNLRMMAYREEYVKQPHIRGWFGQYPAPNYEIGISFEINIDTGQPVPQSDRSYTRTYRENRDFSVRIASTWLDLAEHLPPAVALPIDRSVSTGDYEVIGERYGMSEVSFLPALKANNGDDYALRTNRNQDIFLKRSDSGLLAYMTCQKLIGAVKVAYCQHVEIIDGFLAEVRFKRSLIDDHDTIIRRSREFVNCLFVAH
ncbi:hypothetical protein [Sulfitobacter faviae]|uniref:hypothetical protein n=1 Tax=Sulfitobacter faviae TaxID=1775881 RepID=UPI00398D6234